MLHIGHCSDALGNESCRSYAMAIVELLDPTGKLFGPRIIAQVSKKYSMRRLCSSYLEKVSQA